MAKNENIWKFNEDEWKVHIEDSKLLDKLIEKFSLERSTIYYGNGGLSEETAWDIIVSNNLINKIKKYIKGNT
jgi:hypothetical protein|tara:strand:+ start:710 stop:928 length:219 start_codon:yes stop_codon:yes gene_type:complete